MPERAWGDGDYFASQGLRIQQQIVYASHDLTKSRIGVDLGTTLACGAERPLILYERFWNETTAEIEQRRANARCADVETEDERAGQISEGFTPLISAIETVKRKSKK